MTFYDTNRCPCAGNVQGQCPDCDGVGGWALVCASGDIHTEHGEVPTAVTRGCAVEAAAFMDYERKPDGTRWQCGPHEVVPHGT